MKDASVPWASLPSSIAKLGRVNLPKTLFSLPLLAFLTLCCQVYMLNAEDSYMQSCNLIIFIDSFFPSTFSGFTPMFSSVYQELNDEFMLQRIINLICFYMSDFQYLLPLGLIWFTFFTISPSLS